MPGSRRFARFLAWSLALTVLAGCTSAPQAFRGEAQVAPVTPGDLAQSDVNRMATLAMRDNLDSLLRIADKLYRRNPAQWRKTGVISRDAALRQLRSAIEIPAPWPELQGKREVAALSLALSPDFTGDRVAAFIYASADMLMTAHGGKSSIYLVDGLEAQYIYNAARNIEIAVWLLSSRRNAAGQPLLLADEISAQDRNLSFEREFGKVIGRLDLLAEMLTEKYRRVVITYVQTLLGGALLQFLPVR